MHYVTNSGKPVSNGAGDNRGTIDELPVRPTITGSEGCLPDESGADRDMQFESDFAGVRASRPVSNSRPFVILLADDDPDDRDLALRALRETKVSVEIRFVVNGQELLHYLRREGAFACKATAPTPDLILMDLNMPTLDGREALRQIKTDPSLLGTPVVILTSSKNETDVLLAETLGADLFLTKPVTFEELVPVMHRIRERWIENL
jgi:two-component system response regulator